MKDDTGTGFFLMVAAIITIVILSIMEHRLHKHDRELKALQSEVAALKEAKK